tara:strand:+ start:514 stop:1239 length:726 start_codon:yes stop_codon:yes gene_type:complete
MLYSTIPNTKVQELTKKLLAGEDFDENEVIVQQGSGPDHIDLNAIDQLSRDLEKELQKHIDLHGGGQKNRDLFEGQISGRIHQELAKFPIEVLDDPGFWRYLALTKFWWYAYWRHQETFDERPFPYEKCRVYLDATLSHETIPTRLFLRGQIALIDDANYELAQSTEEVGDFWRSHVTRVLTWTSPRFTQMLLRSQKDDHMDTAKVRPFARRMNRRRSSIILDDYNDEESMELINELRQEE